MFEDTHTLVLTIKANDKVTKDDLKNVLIIACEQIKDGCTFDEFYIYNKGTSTWKLEYV